MKKDVIAKLRNEFEQYVHKTKNNHFWYARDLQSLLGYTKWENFLVVIEKAKEACKNSKQKVSDHFPDVRKTIGMPKGATKEILDYKLSRYACYLIAQNGDSRKEKIAFAQSYFAIQTRKQELIEERIALIERINARKKLTASEIEFSKLLFERDVDQQGIAKIRSQGDKALFGGKTTSEMKEKLKIPKSRAIADYLPTVTITAKNLATEMTTFNVNQQDLHGEPKITKEHTQNNTAVRGVLSKRGIKPETLPAEKDLQRLQKKIKKIK